MIVIDEPETEQEQQALAEIKREWRQAKRERRWNIAISVLLAALLVAGVSVVVACVLVGAVAWPY